MRNFLIGLVRLYQLVLRPYFGSQCRFHPTCSDFMIGALARHGAMRGTFMGLKRILRCQPLCHGGLDPVPME